MRKLISLTISILVSLSLLAQKVDTLYISSGDTTRSLGEVVVKSKSLLNTARATAPVQLLSKEQMETVGALQVSDAVKHFSGVTVKDYGGIGGLKTVSVRSLGAGHTAVSYDGIVLSDAQNGQIDIGKFSLENVDVVSLNNGQSDKIFQTARAMASAAALNISTLSPEFDSVPVKGRVGMKAGSWLMLNPNIFFAARLNDLLKLTVAAEWMSCKGDYPYLLAYGNEGDSVSLERRQNTDVKNLRAEATLFGADSVQSGYFKVYYYQSDRGLPGATIFYNTASFSSQRLFDRNTFAQGHYERRLHRDVDFQLNGKYNYAYTHYLDPACLNTQGYEENHYHQHEFYINAAALYRVPVDGLSVALTTDGIASSLYTDVYNFTTPHRYQWLTGAAVKYVNNWVTASASVLTTASIETLSDGQTNQRYFRASPYASVSFRPFEKVGLRVRAFYKNIFRLPTFNDLYYGKVGNSDLRPETTNQYNIGLTYSLELPRVLRSLSLTCDVYHNDVRDKIVAYPTKNIYTWTMLNYGRVSVTGLDFAGDLDIEFAKECTISLGASYTYNRALNVTSPEASDYKHQIPYTPRISGSGRASLHTPWGRLGWSLVWSGHRYAGAQNYAENRIEGFFDHSLFAAYDLKIKNNTITFAAEFLNITNENYAIVRYFPMPGFSWRASVNWTF